MSTLMLVSYYALCFSLPQLPKGFICIWGGFAGWMGGGGYQALKNIYFPLCPLLSKYACKFIRFLIQRKALEESKSHFHIIKFSSYF